MQIILHRAGIGENHFTKAMQKRCKHVISVQSLRYLIEAMGGPVQGKIQIFIDNTSTLTIATNPVQPGRNAHVHARYFYVRDLAYGNLVEIIHLSTGLQLADIGCTYKGGPTFLYLRKMLIECARIVIDEHGNPCWEMMSDLEHD